MTYPTRKRIACAFVVGALLALAGCTSVPDKVAFDPALFPRQPAETTFDGRVAVLADPAAVAMTVTGESVSRGPHLLGAPAQVPIGRVVHEAALAAFADTFRGGAPTAERAGAEPGAPTVALRVVHYDYHNRRLDSLTLPFLTVWVVVWEKWRLDLQLTIELRLLDVDGAVLWSNVYDSGLRTWEHEAPERNLEELVRMTHETAFALMRDAARDVGEWLRNERLRERLL
jgi:hypothetical protein